MMSTGFFHPGIQELLRELRRCFLRLAATLSRGKPGK
jgi:hypothetical protein